MLTRKQLDLLNYINKHLNKDGIPPSFDEMKEALDLRSKSGIHRLITALEERGFIRRLAHRARAIEIVKLPDSLETNNKVTKLSRVSAKNSASNEDVNPRILSDSVHASELPVMGRIAAGVPIEAISQISHNVAVPAHMLRNGGEHYALEVKGDSMIEEGINDGDIVVIKETKTAVNGDIVVALVKDSEATLKRFFYRGDAIALEAANPAYETRILPSGDVKVQGRLVGLIRSY
jgi:repressor LexA